MESDSATNNIKAVSIKVGPKIRCSFDNLLRAVNVKTFSEKQPILRTIKAITKTHAKWIPFAEQSVTHAKSPSSVSEGQIEIGSTTFG